MTTNHSCNDVLDSEVGPVVPVTGPSRLKPIVAGLLWAALGLVLLAGAVSMLAFELPRLWQEEVEPEWLIVGFAGAFVLVSFPLLAALIRRIRVIRDGRLFFLAGPGGISVCCPTRVNFRALLLSYRIEQYDLSWDQIATWYPHVWRVNGIPVSSRIVFEGTPGWKLEVNTLFFTGTRDSIAQNIATALEPEDQPADKDPVPAAE